MSDLACPELVARLDAARGRARRMLLRAFPVVLGMSLLGVAWTWVAELMHADGAAGVAAGVLVAVWLASGLATLVVVVLLVASAGVSWVLKFLGVITAGRAGERSKA